MFMISRLFRCATPRQMTCFSWKKKKKYFSYCFEKQQQLEKHQKSQYKTVFLAYSRETFFQDFALFSLHDTSTEERLSLENNNILLAATDKNNHWKTTTNFLRQNHWIAALSWDLCLWFHVFSLRDARAVFPGRKTTFTMVMTTATTGKPQENLSRKQLCGAGPQYKPLSWRLTWFHLDQWPSFRGKSWIFTATNGKPQQIFGGKKSEGFGVVSREVLARIHVTSSLLCNTSTNEHFFLQWKKKHHLSNHYGQEQALGNHNKSP